MPEMVISAHQDGLVGQAIEKGLLQLETLNPRKYSEGQHHSVDDRVFGGSDGMLMQAEPLAKAVEEIRTKYPKVKVIHLSPRGRILTDRMAIELANEFNGQSESALVLIASRYAGVDQRFIDTFCDDEISIGDFVLSGGELPACVVIDAVARKVPGVLGNRGSADSDSFSDGLLESSQYTRPREWRGKSVPEILLCGDPKIIEDWRFLDSLEVTARKRPELLTSQYDSRVRDILRSIPKIQGQNDLPAIRKAAYEELRHLAERVLAFSGQRK